MCGRTNNFGQVIQAIGNALVPVHERLERPGSGGGFNLPLPGGIGGVGISDGTKGGGAIDAPGSLNEALDVIRYVASKRTGRGTTILL
jgi:hypothetical protein